MHPKQGNKEVLFRGVQNSNLWGVTGCDFKEADSLKNVKEMIKTLIASLREEQRWWDRATMGFW